jgi:hypothetical protein
MVVHIFSLVQLLGMVCDVYYQLFLEDNTISAGGVAYTQLFCSHNQSINTMQDHLKEKRAQTRMHANGRA